MTDQLILIETRSTPWHLDDTTRATGRRGLAEARATLNAVRRQALERDHAARANSETTSTTDNSPIHATAA